MGVSKPVKLSTVHCCWGYLNNIWVALSTDSSVEKDVKVCEDVKDVKSGSEFQELI